MPYELSLDRKPVRAFETAEEAVEAVRGLLQTQPDSEPEIRDTATGKPFAPAASKEWRNHLATEVGF